jgi:hypothetical protein
MTRFFAFACALLMSLVTVTTTVAAAPSDWMSFHLSPAGHGGDLRADFRRDRNGRHDHQWSSDFEPREFVGLDLAAFRAGGNHPLRFALIRDAGRVDCSGSGGNSNASGNCTVTANPVFLQLLANRGIGRPDRDEQFALVALNARRSLIDTLAAARYPMPDLDNYIALTALGVSETYIRDLARAGYRPDDIDGLIQFKALGISPQWIGGFQRIGYARLPADDLVQMKALGITPDFVLGFERAGYGRLPVDELVQLKALNITPEYARWAASERRQRPEVDDLVQMKIFRR